MTARNDKDVTTVTEEDGQAHAHPHTSESLPLIAAAGWWPISLGIAVGLVLALVSVELLSILAHPLALFILSISIAAATSPLVARLEQWLPRTAAILVVYLAIVVLFGAVGLLTVPTLVLQAQRIGSLVPDLMTEAVSLVGGMGLDRAALANSLTAQAGQLSSALVALPLMLFSSLMEIFLVLVMSLYWLLVADSLRNYFNSFFSRGDRHRIRDMQHDISRSMGGYIRASVINALVIGSLTYVGLALMGVQFPVVLGLLAGLLEFIPLIGPVISGIIVLAVALLQSPTLALIALVFMFLLQQFEGNILVPNIMRSQTEMSPLLVILAILAGNTIGGVLGALVAIPIASALQIVFLDLVLPVVRDRTTANHVEAKKVKP